MEDGSFTKTIKTWKRETSGSRWKRSAYCFDNSRDPFLGGESLGFVHLQRERSFSFLPLIVPANLEVLGKYFPFVSPGNWLWFAVRLKDGVLLSLEHFCSPRQLGFFCFFFLLHEICQHRWQFILFSIL